MCSCSFATVAGYGTSGLMFACMGYINEIFELSSLSRPDWAHTETSEAESRASGYGLFSTNDLERQYITTLAEPIDIYWFHLTTRLELWTALYGVIFEFGVLYRIIA